MTFFQAFMVGALINFQKEMKSGVISDDSSHLCFMSSLMEVMRLSSMTFASRVGEPEVKGEVKKSDTTD